MDHASCNAAGLDYGDHTKKQFCDHAQKHNATEGSINTKIFPFHRIHLCNKCQYTFNFRLHFLTFEFGCVLLDCGESETNHHCSRSSGKPVRL
jgi:hypothetical protein